MKVYPDTTIVANAKTFGMMENFFRDMPLEGRKLEVQNGGTLSLGKHTLTFVFAPMVLARVMVTYDSTDKVLFAADGFGKFGALDVDEPWDDEARRYFIGIVGKYGMQVQAPESCRYSRYPDHLLLHGPRSERKSGPLH